MTIARSERGGSEMDKCYMPFFRSGKRCNTAVETHTRTHTRVRAQIKTTTSATAQQSTTTAAATAVATRKRRKNTFSFQWHFNKWFNLVAHTHTAQRIHIWTRCVLLIGAHHSHPFATTALRSKFLTFSNSIRYIDHTVFVVYLSPWVEVNMCVV